MVEIVMEMKIEVWDKKKVQRYIKRTCAIEQRSFKEITRLVGEEEEYVVIWQSACGHACMGCSSTIILPKKIFREEELRKLLA